MTKADWRIGDAIELIQTGNFDGLRTPNNYTILDINTVTNTYTVRNDQNRVEEIMRREDLDAYFKLLRHTRG